MTLYNLNIGWNLPIGLHRWRWIRKNIEYNLVINFNGLSYWRCKLVEDEDD